MACRETENGSASTATSSLTSSGMGMSIESWAAMRSAHPPGRVGGHPDVDARGRAPRSVKLQHRLSSPRWQGGHGGSMPRGPQVSQGLSNTRWPTSSPVASGPRATTSATTS